MPSATVACRPAKSAPRDCAPIRRFRELDRPGNLSGANAPGWGSDVVADTLRALRHPLYRAQSGRELSRPARLRSSTISATRRRRCCSACTRRAAVAIAHGYAKVTGKAMAAAVHSNVGLFHATMAIFNAWCDRMPIVVLGATGPVDAAKRRPWIDWIHTARDQGAIVRDYTKWDDQPASPAAAREVAGARDLDRQHRADGAGLHQSRRRDAGGEARRAARRRSTSTRFMPPAAAAASPELVKEAAALLKGAKHPVILIGRVSRSVEGWNERVALAETLNAKVITDLKIGCGFPDRPSAARRRARHRMRWCRRRSRRSRPPTSSWPSTGSISRRPARRFRHRRAQDQDHQRQQRLPHPPRLEHGLRGLPPVDLLLPTTPDQAVPELLAALGGAKPRQACRGRPKRREISSRRTVRCGSTTSRARCGTQWATGT